MTEIASPFASFAHVNVDDQDGVRIVTINRPKALNALNQTVLEELQQVCEETARNTDIGVVVLTGAGEKAFVAGADISHMSGLRPQQAKAFAQLGHRVFGQLEALPQPVIAAVNGYALGGGTELALSCDFIYASPNAVFGQPEVKLGLIPGFGGTQRLMRKIPAGMARELIFAGNNIKADEALRIGLVNCIIDAEAGTVLEAALQTARTILKRSAHAVRAAKRVMMQGADIPLSQGNAMEVDAFAMLFDTDHPKEGTTAFLEKRKPQFSSLGEE
jgi:enoyl-CoA hydratase